MGGGGQLTRRTRVGIGVCVFHMLPSIGEFEVIGKTANVRCYM